jgi:peroxiredoxin
MKIWKLAVGVILVAGIVGALLVSGSYEAGSSGIEVAERVPEYSAMDMEGNEVALADYEGQVVLLNIWATWCGPCRIEMPSINALHERYKDRGFTVVAVSIDAGRGYREKVDEFVSEHELDFPILLDPDGRIMRTIRAVGVPETLVLDREGKIVKRVVGATNWDSRGNRAMIEQLFRM